MKKTKDNEQKRKYHKHSDLEHKRIHFFSNSFPWNFPFVIRFQ